MQPSCVGWGGAGDLQKDLIRTGAALVAPEGATEGGRRQKRKRGSRRRKKRRTSRRRSRRRKKRDLKKGDLIGWESEAEEGGHNLREKIGLRVDVLEIFIRKRGQKAASSGIEVLQTIKRRNWIKRGGEVDRSQSLFYFVPQEKNITVKLARLRRSRRRRRRRRRSNQGVMSSAILP